MATGMSARAKETTIIVTMDGETLTGGFNKITSFKETSDAEIVKTHFVGQKVAEGDLDDDGTMISFDTHHTSNVCYRAWQKIKDNDRAGLPPPNIIISVVTKFRDPSLPAHTRQHKNITLKLDSNETPDKGYCKASWSAYSPNDKFNA